MDNVLTIGTAVYDDFDSAWHTIMSLRNHHPWTPVLVLDTKPTADERLYDKCSSENAWRGGLRYFHRPDLSGTAAPRSALFSLADTPWVCVIDSHVDLMPGAVRAMLDYAGENPGSIDLIQGPLVYDDGNPSTHLRPTHPPGLWGTWDTDGLALQGGKPFDVHALGLGHFMMRKAAWPGFHPLHRGFGGEEGYLHAKVRKRGGRTLCHPAMGWVHKFRDPKNPRTTYHHEKTDEVFNLLVEHRELGIDAAAQIATAHAEDWQPVAWAEVVRSAEAAQPFGEDLPTRPRLKLLGVWYSNNAAPGKVMQASLRSTHAAASSCVGHDVRVATCSWVPVPGNPFPWVGAELNGAKGHAAILEQQSQAIKSAIAKHDPRTGSPFDAVAFLEHDVLYPADYFDRIGNAFADNPDAPVVSNLDYIGLNATGWQRVKERHEPLHQIAMRWRVAAENHRRARADCDRQGWAYLEPDHDRDRSGWVRIPHNEPGPMGEWRSPHRPPMPSVHVNYPAHAGGSRLTTHGEVCYEAESTLGATHVYWGKAKNYWEGDMACGTCGQGGTSPVKAAFASAAEWFEAASKTPSDCHEHLPTVKALADKCGHVTELNHWGSPWLASLAASAAPEVVSYGPGEMPNWGPAGSLPRSVNGPAKFEGRRLDPLAAADFAATDLLLTDTRHTGDRLYSELSSLAPKVRKYIVVHDTDVFGERGDDGTPGLMHGLRKYLTEHPEWTMVRRDANNYGLAVLARDSVDKAEFPSWWQMTKNAANAVAENVRSGGAAVPADVKRIRLDLCAVCPHRVDGRCGKCGCYLDLKTSLAVSRCAECGRCGKPEHEHADGKPASGCDFRPKHWDRWEG